MPYGDRTGPMGLGPKTGRGMGFCAGYSSPGFMNRGPFRGPRGFGGRGIGRILEDLSNELEGIKKRIEELEEHAKTKKE